MLLGAWQILSFSGNGNISSPAQIVHDLPRYLPTMLASLAPSLLRAAIGLTAAIVIGIVAGYFLGRYVLVNTWLDAPVNWLRPVPAPAFIPLFVYWFGLSDVGPILIVALTAVFPIILNTAAGIRSVDRRLRETVESLGASRRQLFWCVEFPGSMPFIMTGVRIAVTAGWAAIVAAEMFGAQSGLGYQIWVFANYLQMSGVITGVIFLGLIGFTLDAIVQRMARRLTHWAQVTAA